MSAHQLRQAVAGLASDGRLPDAGLAALIDCEEAGAPLAEAADAVRRRVYGRDVFIRGLIELTNYCKNNCYYCGIRAGNKKAERYRLEPEEILSCCREGWDLGFRTFVLQGGEDEALTDEKLIPLVASIRRSFPQAAITLSLGERSRESYEALFAAGADRYLLRHETANPAHYAKLHPPEMRFDHRLACLRALRETGYQVGSGFMVGAPFQETADLIMDLRLLEDIQPDMIGIGPFLRHADTPFRSYENGSLQKTLRLISILRLMFPAALIPATTALGTIVPGGRELGLQAGANVVMPNLSPERFRSLYTLYDNKLAAGPEAAEGLRKLEDTVRRAGYEIVVDVGNPRTAPDGTT